MYQRAERRDKSNRFERAKKKQEKKRGDARPNLEILVAKESGKVIPPVRFLCLLP